MATSTTVRHHPDHAIPPGEILGLELRERGLRQRDLAMALGLRTHVVSLLVRGLQPVTPEIANALEQYLGVAAELWLNLQSSYQEDLERLSVSR